ncbi:MAG: YkgJ family cysteine cluster protein [Candidatus Odinarchaeota archaeon]
MSCNDFDLDTIVYLRFEVLTGTAGSYTINIPYVCQRCGACCLDNTFPGNNQDLQRIADFLGTTTVELISKYSRATSTTLGNRTSNRLPDIYPCIFFRDSKCTVYPVRPSICRKWFFRGTGRAEYGDKGVIACPAYSRLNTICETLLEGVTYRAGIREVISIGKKSTDLISFSVAGFEEIQERITADYYPPDENQAKRIWNIFQSFEPADQEKRLFTALNPVLSKLFDVG